MDILSGVGSKDDLEKARDGYDPKSLQAQLLQHWLDTPLKVRKWSVDGEHKKQLSSLMLTSFPSGWFHPPDYSFALVIGRAVLLSMAMFTPLDSSLGYMMWNACTHPKCRRQGLVSRLIRGAQTIVQREEKILQLKVETKNPHAITLYKKHNFIVIEETDDVLLMQWKPKTF